MVAPRFRCRPTVSLAATKGPKSGWCASSTGVGTATTMKSALPSSAASVVTRSPDEDSNSARLTSPVGSWQSRYAAIFPSERSKPIVGYFFPNSTARGRPTYPRPTTATTVTSTPFVVFAREPSRGRPMGAPRATRRSDTLQRHQQRRDFRSAIRTSSQRRRFASRSRRRFLRRARTFVIRGGFVSRLARLREGVQLLARSRLVTGFDERFGQVQPDIGLVGRVRRCLPELFESLSHVALLHQQHPQRVQHRGIRRCERRRFFGIRQC